ncbi:hypothetical protein O181_122253 [Austropuccinia psidii MF-1]|uniref:Uncharacterized protein n=1 Tax=Austropuccinia psidii MF-1 TaxID=1389203 RepID=A0A9Q3KJ26_9BASI|nr:hypothetical protein [Austropuccinia psidii MF-1]
MDNSRTSTSSKRLSSTLDTPLECLEAEITDIPVVRPESFLTGKKGVATSAKPLDKDHELLYSSKEALGPSKERGPSEGLDSHFLQRKSTKDKGLIEKPKNVFRGPEERAGPKEGQQPSGSSSSLHNQESTSKIVKKKERRPQREIRRARKRKSPSGTNLTHRITELKRKKRQPWTMCSIWKKL